MTVPDEAVPKALAQTLRRIGQDPQGCSRVLVSRVVDPYILELLNFIMVPNVGKCQLWLCGG